VSENEQIRLQTQQLEQRAILGEVNAIFAHEVRNPINNISTGLQLMESTLAQDDKNREVIARLQQDCSRLTHLMESVLAFSRPMEYTMEPVDLALLLQNLIERWRPRLARLKIETNIQVAPDTPKVNGNPRALEQVFVNLVSNASQAMGETGGFLVMKNPGCNTNSQLPEVEVTVSDTGPGIPEEIRDHIFEPFVTTSKKGTGLGLAITKRIVVAHKGTISVNSVPGGTVFVVRLPLLRRFYCMASTLLIVDDEENARVNISDYLIPKGYEVIGVPTLSEARACLKQGVADIILLDVNLPDGYGLHC
jgi:signal transduction histidine kinase